MGAFDQPFDPRLFRNLPPEDRTRFQEMLRTRSQWLSAPRSGIDLTRMPEAHRGYNSPFQQFTGEDLPIYMREVIDPELQRLSPERSAALGVDPNRELPAGATDLEVLRLWMNRPEDLAAAMSSPHFYDYVSEARRGLGLTQRPPPRELVQASPGTQFLYQTPEGLEYAGGIPPEPSEKILTLQHKGKGLEREFRANDPMVDILLDSGWRKVDKVQKSEVRQYTTDLTPTTTSNVQEGLVDYTDRLARISRINQTVARLDDKGFTDEFLTKPGRFRAWLYEQGLQWKALDPDSPQADYAADYKEFERVVYNDMNLIVNSLSGAAVSPAEMERLQREMLDLKKLSGPAFRQRLASIQHDVKLAMARKVYFLKRGLTTNPAATFALADTEAMMKAMHIRETNRYLSENPGMTTDDGVRAASGMLRDTFGLSIEDL